MNKNKNNTAYYILIILILIIFIIYIIHNRVELFSNPTENTTEIPLINLPNNDIHFISDDDIKSIYVSVFNYKLMVNVDNKISSSSLSNTTSQDNINLLLQKNKKTKYLSVFEHKPFANYKGLGQTLIITDTPYDNVDSAINSMISDINSKSVNSNNKFDRKCLNYLTSSPFKPLGYNLIWTSDINDDNKIFSVWSPINPAGCASLGDVIIMGTEQPSIELFACYPITLLEKKA